MSRRTAQPGNRFSRARLTGAAFTIIEMLTVIAVVGAILAMILPALSSFHSSSRAVASKSNLRQWGLATIAFCAANDDLLPWEGFKGAAEMHLNFAEPTWWANALPPFAGQAPYRQVAESAPVPLPPDDSTIFVDPAAQAPHGAPHVGGLPGNPAPFFFCYVPNLQLNNSVEAKWLASGRRPRMRLASLRRCDATILMLEMRTVQNELPQHDPFFAFTLVRARADWKRLAARHRDGGHLLFADGHVAHFDFKYATTNSAGTRNPDEPNADWNRPDLIWNPSGPAVEGPGN